MVRTTEIDNNRSVNNSSFNESASASLNPTERLFIERLLLQMYPRLQRQDLIPWKWFLGPLIPDFIVRNTNPYCRRIVEIGCGDGVFTNLLAFLFPETEIVGIDANRDLITAARATVGQRKNLKFLCANAAVLSEIPCDRIIYNNCLSQLGSVYEFKKMLVKTSSWLVDEGDWIWKQSAWACLPLMKELCSRQHLQKVMKSGVKGILSQILEDVGYRQPLLYQAPGLAGFPATIFYHANQVSGNILPNSLLIGEQEEREHRTLVGKPSIASRQSFNGSTQEWENWGDQSNDSLVNFLFSNGQPAFDLELI